MKANNGEYTHDDYLIRPGGKKFEHLGAIIDLEKVSDANLKRLADDPTCYQVQHKRNAEERKAIIQKATTVTEVKRLLKTESAKTVQEAAEKRIAEIEKSRK